jgi:hypothetical protein
MQSTTISSPYIDRGYLRHDCPEDGVASERPFLYAFDSDRTLGGLRVHLGNMGRKPQFFSAT